MQPQELRTVFMGTPDFALQTLQGLIDAGCNMVGVYTQPDRPKGRGKQLAAPPVKELAQQHDIPVYQPLKLRQPEAVAELEALAPDLIVVVAYGQILPKSVLEIPAHGCINVHASLLPKYRGAAPINKAIIDGETETGITTMYMDVGLDTGDMLIKRASRSAQRKRQASCTIVWQLSAGKRWMRPCDNSVPKACNAKCRMTRRAPMPR